MRAAAGGVDGVKLWRAYGALLVRRRLNTLIVKRQLSKALSIYRMNLIKLFK